MRTRLTPAKYTRNRNTHTHTTHMPPSGQSPADRSTKSFTRHTTYFLQNTHAIETKPPHTHMPPFNLISDLQRNHSHMRHTTYSLQNTHAIETSHHTHAHATVSIFNAIVPPHDTTYRKFSLCQRHPRHVQMPISIKIPPSPRSIVGFPIPTIVNVLFAGTVIVDDKLQSSVQLVVARSWDRRALRKPAPMRNYGFAILPNISK